MYLVVLGLHQSFFALGLNEFGIVITFMVNGAVIIKKYFFELFTSRNVNEKSTLI